MPIFPDKYVDVESATIYSNTPNKFDRLPNGYTYTRRIGDTQWWEIDIKTPDLSYRDAMELDAFLLSLAGRFEIFTIRNPFPQLGANTNTPGVYTMSSAGQRVVKLHGLSPNQTDCFVAGDFIRFRNHAKVYKIVQTVDSNAQGEATIQIFPELRKDVDALTLCDFGNNCFFTVQLDNDISDFSLSARRNMHTSFKIGMTEYVNQ